MKVPEPGAASEPNRARRSLLTILISSEGREWVRKRTLNRLAVADWGCAPMLCLVAGSVDWMSLFLRIRKSLGSRRLKQINYLLFLHDDLQLNRWLRHNLCHWLRFHSPERLLASLSNSGVRAEACDVHNYTYFASPGQKHSTPAFVISGPLFARITAPGNSKLHAGDERPILSRLADALNQPVAYHYPSLVQIRESSGNGFGLLTPAADYEPSWRRPDDILTKPRGRHQASARDR
jgi:hypothetical protein